MLPSLNVFSSTVHRSNQDSSAYSHSSILDLRALILSAEKLIGEPPQPRQREKSLPVPIGMMPKTRLSVLIPALARSSTTHITDPSPPHTITLT